MDTKDKTVTMTMEEYKNLEKKIDEFEANKIVIQAFSIRFHGGQFHRITYKGRDEAIKEIADMNAELVAKVNLLDEDCQKLQDRNKLCTDLKSRFKFLFTGEATYEE